jgi:hypothetical protein
LAIAIGKIRENDDEPTDGMDGMDGMGWGGLYYNKCKWLESNNQFSESQLMFMAVLAITFMKIYQQRVA